MTWPLGLDVATRKAVVILASQKTLPIAVTVISLIDDGSFEAGLDEGLLPSHSRSYGGSPTGKNK